MNLPVITTAANGSLAVLSYYRIDTEIHTEFPVLLFPHVKLEGGEVRGCGPVTFFSLGCLLVIRKNFMLVKISALQARQHNLTLTFCS